jgi:hypothetical protein
MFRAACWLISLPFRIVAWVVVQLGRIAAVSVGFILMVLGVALGAGAFYIFGIPLFVIGLLLTIRAIS